MNDSDPLASRRIRVERFLRDRGADTIDHPGGTLLAHLNRVADTLASWGHDADLQLAGLAHWRFVHFGGRPGFFPTGSSGCNTAHCASVRSPRTTADIVSTRSLCW